jgi:hypothetical protein
MTLRIRYTNPSGSASCDALVEENLIALEMAAELAHLQLQRRYELCRTSCYGAPGGGTSLAAE